MYEIDVARTELLLIGVGVFVNAALAVGAFLYTWEARQLRLQTIEQLKHMRHQTRLSVAPTILLSLRKYDEAWIMSKLTNKEALSPEEREVWKRLIGVKPTPRYVCVASNPSTKFGLYARACVYDTSNRSYYACGQGLELLRPSTKESVAILSTAITFELAAKDVFEEYNDGYHFIADVLKPRDMSFVALFFTDMEGRLYAICRPFYIDDQGRVHHHRSQVYREDDGHSDEHNRSGMKQ